jgi:PAS domain S-box-containing protein
MGLASPAAWPGEAAPAMQKETELPQRRARRSQIAIVTSVVATILVLWAVVGTSNMFDRQAAFERTRSNASNLAAAFSDHLAHTLDGINAAMDLLAGEFRARGDAVDLQAWTQGVPVLALGTIQVAIIGPDGKLISTSLDPKARGLDLSDRAHFRVHLDGSFKGLYVSEPVVGRVSKQTTLNITRRVEAEDGRFLGVLMFALPPRKLTTLLDLVEVGDRSIIALEGVDGVLRARFSHGSPDGAVAPGLKLPGGPRLDVAADDSHGTYVTTSMVDHVTRLYGYRRVPRYPLVTTVGLDVDEALAATTRRTWSLIGLTVAGTLLLAGLAGLLVREIGRRAEREERLIYSRRHLALAQGVAHVGSILRDFRTGIVEWSDGLYAILGVERDKVVPGLKALVEFVHPDDRAAVLADRDAAVRGEPQKLPEYRIVRPDGAVRVVQRKQSIIRDDEHGNPMHLLVAFQDVTEMREEENKRHALERQLHHSQKLEALGTLAGGIAHDLNNTLVPIITISKLSLKHAKPGSPEYEDLELIYRAGVRARDLVKQVVAFSRKDVANRRLFKVDEILSEALAMLRPTIPSMIRIELSVGQVPPVMGDPSQIHQVIVNLMTNAVQAIGLKHGQIFISLEEIPSPAAGTARLIRLAVADTGCGMDEETKRRIFDPFFTTKAVGEGTGLGLSVVHGIVSNHNGSITVESTPAHGTRFVVDLPVAAVATESDAVDQRSVA